MTARNPLPPAAFASALTSLDGEAFASLVGETYAATADAVEVDAPRITVVNGDRRTELLAVSAASERADDDPLDDDPLDDDPLDGDPPDAIVVARDSLLEDGPLEADTTVVTPADLRQRLLYAMSPAEANAITDRILDVPMWSPPHDDAPAPGAAETPDVSDADGVTAGTDTTPRDSSSATTASTPVSAFRSLGTATTENTDRGTDDTVPSTDRSRPDESRPSETPEERDRPWTLVAVVVAIALIAAAAVGAASIADDITAGGADGAAGVDPGDATTSSPTGSDTDPDAAGDDRDDAAASDENDTTAANEPSDGDPTDGTADEAARNTAVDPTCDRSALQVVQVQMNALRYNDDATNDGIRTARAFASPANRRAVGSLDQFVSLFETPAYAPMLTYDTARYSVPEIDDGTAEIEVVTRENGSVTGRYEFRLTRVPGGSSDADDDLGEVDDCWMTDAVAASTD
ncbi:MAG: hypothetical protein R6U01_12590 [Halorubrum sp.]|uniref:hypothetical protein n=1 Tax=Halorubrum sp. TaxID=1879286 RepID=UPI003970C1BE